MRATFRALVRKELAACMHQCIGMHAIKFLQRVQILLLVCSLPSIIVHSINFKHVSQSLLVQHIFLNREPLQCLMNDSTLMK